MCYNTTYKSPPVMEQGRFELPRQLASKPQTCHVCQFHHCSELTAEGTRKTQGGHPSAAPQNKLYNFLTNLSIDKTTQNVLNNDNKNNTRSLVMAVCPFCYSREMIRHGKYKRKQRWLCLKCKRTTLKPRQRVPKGYGS